MAESTPKKRRYQLVLRYEIPAIDDVEARRQAADLLACISGGALTPDRVKLQQVFEAELPRSVHMTRKETP